MEAGWLAGREVTDHTEAGGLQSKRWTASLAVRQALKPKPASSMSSPTPKCETPPAVNVNFRCQAH
eukprot:162450-Pelagomonas_calceolata.AAC.1